MNRLEIVKMTRQLAGVEGTAVSTVNQSGEAKRVVDWCDHAWEEIQQAHNWNFLWEAATVTITANTNATAGTVAARRYLKDATYNGQNLMTYLAWELFRSTWPTPLIAAGVPTIWTIRPDKALAVNAKPTADLVLSVERYKNPTPMATDTDVPAMPAEHHMAIVYKALLLYANFEEAGVTRATAQSEFNRHMGAMGIIELPDVTFGAPLL